VPVPLDPGSGASRIAALGAVCGAVRVVLPEGAEELRAHLAAARAARGAAVPPVVATVGETASRGRPLPAPEPADTALVQFTSGSTGEPKGVVLGHRQVLANLGQMTAGMEITAADVFVSWLPLCHDMGLVLMALVPFSLGAGLVLLPTRLTDVGAWPAAIAAHRGTFTAAPDFAWRLLLRAVRDPGRHDLGSLRVALNAAEPVRPETLRRFHRAFGIDRVMVPGYGLAEATVGVSMQPPGTAPAVCRRGLVSIGRPFPGVTVEVIADGGPAAPGEVGELVVESPALTSGYFGDPEATRDLFLSPRALRTGDLGFADGEGHLYVVGRRKNVILQGGRNLAPQELEEAVEELPFVRRAAAVGIDRGRAEGEQAFVFAELRKAAPPPEAVLAEMAGRAVAAVDERLGLRPGRVVLLAPRGLPLTPNGKVRHGALRDGWRDGSLVRSGAVLFPLPRHGGAP
jgi:acyl-CoA synthetase (AMP-forming)/AMP-acid ligase II